MAAKLTLTALQIRKKASQNCKSLHDMARLLRCTHFELQYNAQNPLYYTFQISKKNGGFRQIEASSVALKKIQRRLNELFQAHYYFERPRCSHGFIASVKGTKNPCKYSL